MDLVSLLDQQYVAQRDARFWSVVCVDTEPDACSLVVFNKPIGLGVDYPDVEASTMIRFTGVEGTKLEKAATFLQIKEELSRMACIMNLGEITLAFTHGQAVPVIPNEVYGTKVEGGAVEIDPNSKKNKEARGKGKE